MRGFFHSPLSWLSAGLHCCELRVNDANIFLILNFVHIINNLFVSETYFERNNKEEQKRNATQRALAVSCQLSFDSVPFEFGERRYPPLREETPQKSSVKALKF